MLRKVAVATAVLLTLTGCSGGSGSSGGSANPLTAQQIADNAGCTLKSYGSPQLYAKATYLCGAGEINLFSTSDLRDSWLKVAEGFGGSYVVGDTWEIDGFGPSKMQQIASATRGTVKP